MKRFLSINTADVLGYVYQVAWVTHKPRIRNVNDLRPFRIVVILLS